MKLILLKLQIVSQVNLKFCHIFSLTKNGYGWCDQRFSPSYLIKWHHCKRQDKTWPTKYMLLVIQHTCNQTLIKIWPWHIYIKHFCIIWNGQRIWNKSIVSSLKISEVYQSLNKASYVIFFFYYPHHRKSLATLLLVYIT